MPRVFIDTDELWPFYSVRDTASGSAYDLPIEVTKNQLNYWEMVTREWERVQRQMETALCAARKHAAPSVGCLHCYPSEEPQP